MRKVRRRSAAKNAAHQGTLITSQSESTGLGRLLDPRQVIGNIQVPSQLDYIVSESIGQGQKGKGNTVIVEKIVTLTAQERDAVDGSTRGCIGWPQTQSFWCTGRRAAPFGSLAQSSQGEVWICPV